MAPHSRVLRYHVVSGRVTPEQLAGSHQTLSGDTLEVSGLGEDFTVDGRADWSTGISGRRTRRCT